MKLSEVVLDEFAGDGFEANDAVVFGGTELSDEAVMSPHAAE